MIWTGVSLLNLHSQWIWLPIWDSNEVPRECIRSKGEAKSISSSYFDSAGSTFVFSVDEVFSYRVVDRRGIIPLDGPTVRFPFDGSNFEVALLLGFTGLAKAAKNKNVNHHLTTVIFLSYSYRQLRTLASVVRKRAGSERPFVLYSPWLSPNRLYFAA